MSEDIFTRVQRKSQRLGDGAIKWGDVEGEATREAPAQVELRLPAPAFGSTSLHLMKRRPSAL